MKCKRCRKATAAVELRSHNAAFCPECFFLFFRRQVEEGIRKQGLLAHNDRVLVCVSGGKDSLVLWDELLEMGYDAEGLYIGLGIPGYSDRSKEKVLAFAEARGKKPIVVDLRDEGVPIPEAARANKKHECSVCGVVKRYFFNRVAAEGNFTVVATGHNLDDESGRLLGNLLHWQKSHIARQHPLLQADTDGLVRKIKPLWRLSELETASYAFLKGIDFVIEECPMSVDATSLVYKEALSLIEDKMPGSRFAFYAGFLDRANPVREAMAAAAAVEAASFSPGPTSGEPRGTCDACGAPTLSSTCGYCRMKAKTKASPKEIQ
jgi:tRNA-5-methyluridine54 2-sulfurtransferase